MELWIMLKTLFKQLMILPLILSALDSSAQTESEKEKTAEKEKKKKPPEISTKAYNKIAPSVVKIECDEGNKIGSGTIVGLNENGRAIILTACHVVAIDFENTPADSPLRFYDDIVVRLATDTATVRSCEVLGFQHREKDLVLIATREPVPEKNLVINYNRSKHAGPGTLVAAMGFPDSDKLSQTVGNIKRWEGGFLIFDANIAPGSSGGPLIDKFGRMVGMSRFTFEGEGYAVPLDSLSTLVDGWLKKIILNKRWQRQKYGNLGQRMTRDWRFVLAELSLVGTIAYLSRPVEPDLPGPPSLP
jgi:S1-C subfamily serine protease